MTKRLLQSALGLMLLAAAGLLAVGWFGSNIALRPPWYVHRTPEQGLRPVDNDAFLIEGWQAISHDPKRDLGLDFASVEFPAVDASTLRGWFVPGLPDARVGVVAIHGGGADRRDFLRHVPVFHDPGYPLLLFDCREQGISDGSGRGISLGIREHEDVSSAVAYLKDVQGLEQVAVVGTSQGAASAILAAAADPRIDAVIAENPFTSIDDLIAGAGPAFGRKLPGFLTALISRVVLWRMDGEDLPSPLEAIPHIAPRPLFLMHGDADQVIPFEQSRRLYLATSGHAELWIAPGADHARLFNKHPDEWRMRVQKFLFDQLGSPHGRQAEAPVSEASHPS